MISIREAINQKVTKLRQPHWANPRDHIELQFTEAGLHGPWVKPWVNLWSEMNESCGFENPHKLLIVEFDLSKKEWQEYVP